MLSVLAAKPSWLRLTNRRGAVYLLAVYFTSLLLLVLSGVSLQRTMQESHAASLSRDNAQAFYLAEAAMDAALVRMRTERLADGTTADVSTATGQVGSSRYAILTESANVLPGASIATTQQQFIRRIDASGAIRSGQDATVQSSVLEEGPLSGIWSNGVIVVSSRGVLHRLDNNFGYEILPATLIGDLHSNLGMLGSIRIQGPVDVQGDVHIGPPRESEELFELADYRENDAYLSLIGYNESTDGIVGSEAVETVTVMGKTLVGLPASQITSASARASVSQIEPISNPYENWKAYPLLYQAICGKPIDTNQYVASAAAPVSEEATISSSGKLTVSSTSSTLTRNPEAPWWIAGNIGLHLYDGGAVPPEIPLWTDAYFTPSPYTSNHLSEFRSSPHAVVLPGSAGPRDLGAPGRITLCVPYVDVNEGDLIFHAPTTLYVTGSKAVPDRPLDMRANDFAVRVAGQLGAVDSQGRLIPDGVHVIVTDMAGDQAGGVYLNGAFSGSVYAPQSTVVVKGGYETLGAVAGREVFVGISGPSLTLGSSSANEGETESGETPITLLSWTN